MLLVRWRGTFERKWEGASCAANVIKRLNMALRLTSVIVHNSNMCDTIDRTHIICITLRVRHEINGSETFLRVNRRFVSEHTTAPNRCCCCCCCARVGAGFADGFRCAAVHSTANAQIPPTRPGQNPPCHRAVRLLAKQSD